MSAPLHDPKIERILLQTVPWEARKGGGNLLQDCLRDFREAAEASVLPANASEKRIALSKEDSELIGALCTAVYAQKALEWLGDDGVEKSISALWETAAAIGLALGRSEAQQEFQASDVPPSPLPRSVTGVATQTDEVAAAAPPVPALPRLDWAEDAAALPVVPPHSASPPASPRDFSALCTGSPQPFASLQRRRRRPPTSTFQNHSVHRDFIRRPRQKNVIHYPAGRRAPLPYSHRPPSIPFPAPTSLSPSDALDWDQDPRLRDLGQALVALGWVRL
ncbi:hypothetical protein C8R47DRAFT_1100594 [Mycena vitilis]|nr:hypothetical protein C8R47DRAFT_1100594 [Mycena vitilis]